MTMTKKAFKKQFKRTDYNDAMINALGLTLHYELNTEWPILNLIQYFRDCATKDGANIDDATDVCAGEFDFMQRHCMLWQMLILMFGDYGTSPRSGWIYREYCNDAADFLEYVLAYKKCNYIDNPSDRN